MTDTGNVAITGTAAAAHGHAVAGRRRRHRHGDRRRLRPLDLDLLRLRHTLPEGTAAFTAAEKVAGQTSDPSADWLVTVDETNPVVTLTAPATTTSENPLLRVVVTDLNEPPDGTSVTIKVYNSSGTTLLNTNTSAATLTDGQASFRLAYALTPGTTYQIKAPGQRPGRQHRNQRRPDRGGHVGDGLGDGLGPGPDQRPAGRRLPGPAGQRHRPGRPDLDQSPGTQAGGAALVYNSDSTQCGRSCR